MSATSTAAVPPLFTAAFNDDPYPTYRHHLNGPALQLVDEPRRIWGIFRYAQCVTYFRDARLSVERPPEVLVRTSDVDRREFQYLIDHMNRWLLLRDAPSHTELRKAMNRGFSPAIVERMREGVELIVSRLLDSMQKGGEIDIVRDIAYPLPVKVISHLLGIPEALHDRCVVLTNDLASWFGNVARSAESARIAQPAVQELVDIFRVVIDERRAAKSAGPGDLLELLLQIADSDSRISDDELHSQCVMLLFGGHETTRHWIGNAVHTLLGHPEALAALQADPALIRGAMEEVLRFESPVKFLSRVITADIEMEGRTAPKGHTLMFGLAAAHRDPAQFSNPDCFDIHRTHVRHLAFGGDAHVCLGSTLARLEGQVAVRELVRRFPGLRRARPEASWTQVTAFRGLLTLPVTL
jgi:cytochrome P450